MSLEIYTEPTSEPLHVDEAKLHLRVDSTADDTLITALIQAAREYCELFQRRAYVVRTYILRLDRFSDIMELPYAPLVSVDTVKYIDTAGDTQTLSSTYYDVDTKLVPGVVRLAYNQSWPTIRSTPDAVTITYNAGYITPFTAAADTDIITVSGRAFEDADIVRLTHSGGDDRALPAGLAVKTDYHVRDYSAYTLKLAATADGAAIDITDAGTGTLFIGELPETIKAAMKLLVGHWYENRELSAPINISEVPMTVKNLLWMERIF